VLDLTVDLEAVSSSYAAMDQRTAMKVMVRPERDQNRRMRRKNMSESQEPTPAQKLIGDFSPKMVSLTDEVLFGDVWERTELSKRDRSLITVAALIAGGNTEQLSGHLMRAKDNGLTETELKEVMTHLAFYAGWPKAMSAIAVAKRVFVEKE
jgi:4-carboxymuconolactone decarboxylase